MGWFGAFFFVFWTFFFALSSIRNDEQNLFNAILLHLRKVFIQATKVFEPQKDSEPTENSVLELLSPERPLFHFRCVLALTVLTDCTELNLMPNHLRTFLLGQISIPGEESRFSTGRFAGLWEGVSIPARRFTFFIGWHTTLCQMPRREITTLQSTLLILPRSAPF